MTGFYRVTRRSFLNPEDANGVVGDDPEKIKKALAWVETVFSVVSKVHSENDDVERVVRAHRNDLENIPIFMILALLYVTTNPDYDTAKVN